MKVRRSRCTRRPRLTTDGEELMSHGGVGLLAELVDRSGPAVASYEEMGRCGISWQAHDRASTCPTWRSRLRMAPTDCRTWRCSASNRNCSVRSRHRLRPGGPSRRPRSELRGIARAAAVLRERVSASAGPAHGHARLPRHACHSTLGGTGCQVTYKPRCGFHPLAVWLDTTAEHSLLSCAPATPERRDADHMCTDGVRLSTPCPSDDQVGRGPGDDPAAVRFRLLFRTDPAGATHDFLDTMVTRERGACCRVCHRCPGPSRHHVLPGRGMDPSGQP